MRTQKCIEVERLVRDCVPTLSLPGVNSKRRASLSRVDQHAAFAASTPMFTSPIIDTIIEGTDGLLCLRKTQAMRYPRQCGVNERDSKQ